MRRGVWGAAGLFAFVIWSSLAHADCVEVKGIGPSIDRFIADVKMAHERGRGTMPETEALIGVTAVDVQDRKRIAARSPLELIRQGDRNGRFANDGPAAIAVAGDFAGGHFVFEIPKHVRGSYRVLPDGIEFDYDDPALAINMAERILILTFKREIRRIVVTSRQLQFFYVGNDGSQPDRCYAVGRNATN